jgi:hypothetical protein
LDNFDSGKKNFGVVNDDVFHELLFFLSQNNIKVKDDKIDISCSNKLSIALLALRNGADIVNTCSKINWHDFELVSSEILKCHGYYVYTNFRLKNPRQEIDVIGVKSQIALVVDCKHWKRNSLSNLKYVVEKQKKRSVNFIQKSKMKIESAFPLILTFLPASLQFIDDVPIIPIDKLNSFLLDFDGYCQNMFKV